MTEETTTPPKRGVPLWTQIAIWVGLLALLVVVGLGLRRAQQGTVQPGEQIPNFALTLFSNYEYNGQTEVHLGNFEGKVVVLNFWASWCKPCEQEAAELQEAWEYYEPGGEVIFLGVDYVDTEPEARVYLKKYGISFPNGPDLGTKVSQYFRIKGVPETYFIDRTGTLRYIQVGPFSSVSQIKQQVELLLAE
jgi:cytochrome c biogenesis protein CcmG/thiol:disulfide interchange protein DsbE